MKRDLGSLIPTASRSVVPPGRHVHVGLLPPAACLYDARTRAAAEEVMAAAEEPEGGGRSNTHA